MTTKLQPTSIAPSSGTRSASASPSPLSQSPAPSLSPSPSPIPSSYEDGANKMDRLYSHAERYFNPPMDPKKKDKPPIVTTKLDEASIDFLYELNRSLNVPEIVKDLGRHHAMLVKMFTEKILPRCEGYMVRMISTDCLLQLLEYNSNSLHYVYTDLVNLVSHKDQPQRLAGLTAFARCIRRFGKRFVPSALDVVTTLNKLSKREENVCKELILDVISALYEGTKGPRSSDPNSLDFQKTVNRYALDKNPGVRKATANCIKSIMIHTEDGRELDVLLPICIKGLLDADLEVRYEFSVVMGIILHVAMLKDPAKQIDPKVKPKKMVYEVRTLDDALSILQKLFAKYPQASLRASLSVALKSLMQASVDMLDETTVSGYAMTIISFVFKSKGPDSERDGRQLAACMSIALVEGVLCLQSEKGLELVARSILNAFSPSTKSSATTNPLGDLNEWHVVVGLQCLTFIFSRLGAAVEHLDVKDIALETLLTLLSSPHVFLRIHVAQCFRSLARAAPSHIATWLSVIEQVIGLHVNELCEGNVVSEGHDPFSSLHGHVCAISAVIGVIPDCVGGVSISMLEHVFDIAKRLINLQMSAYPHTDVFRLQECGWMMLASLIGLGQEWVLARLNSLFSLWRVSLGTKSIDKLDNIPMVCKELNVRGRALMSLRAFVHVMKSRMSVLPGSQLSPVLKAVTIFLRTSFSLVNSLQSDKNLDPIIMQSLPVIKAPLMDIFAAVPSTSYSVISVPLLHMVVSEFTTHSPPLATELQRLLNPADNTLMYSGVARTSILRFADLTDLETAMQIGADIQYGGGSVSIDYSFNWCLRPDSFSDGLLSTARSVGTPDHEDGNAVFLAAPSSRNNTDAFGLHSFECYESPAVRSVNACIRLFASVFSEQTATHKEQLIRHFLAIVQKAKSNQSLGSSVLGNIGAAVLGSCKDFNRHSAPIGSMNALVPMVSISMELLASPNPHIRRAAGECLGLLVRIEDDNFLSKLFGVLRKQLESKDQNTVCAALFAFGCVHRYGGGLKTMSILQFTVAALQTMCKDFNQETLRIWIMHSLWLTIDTGGVAFASYVQPTLAMLTAHTLHDIEPRPALISLTLGRILHSIFAALGPEMTNPAAAGVPRCYNIWTHLSSETIGLVEAEVLFSANQMVLWSSVRNERQLVSLLEKSLDNEEEATRVSGIQCIMRWGEKDKRVVTQYGFHSKLMTRLDKELSYSACDLLRHTLLTFIRVHGVAPNPDEPASQKISAQLNGSSPKNTQSKDPKDTQDSSNAKVEKNARFYLLDMLKRTMTFYGHRLPSDNASLAAERHEHSEGADEDETIVTDVSKEPNKSKSNGVSSTDKRWQTKSFALDGIATLLLSTDTILTNSPHELDLVYARKHAKYPLQYLVQQLLDLLTVACMATSSAYDCLRVKGAIVMLHIVECFSSVLDPDGEGELLLQLYSAQVTSALSQSMKNKSDTVASAPHLRAAACNLAVVFLTSGISSDEIVFQRVIKSLLQTLQKPQEVHVLYAQYDGSMITFVLLSHLAALARLHTACLERPTKVSKKSSKQNQMAQPRAAAISTLSTILSPHMDWLQEHYLSALKDYSLLNIASKKDLSRIKGTYFDAATSTKVISIFDQYWEIFLRISSSLLQSGKSKAAHYTGSYQHPFLHMNLAIQHLYEVYSTEQSMGDSISKSWSDSVSLLAKAEIDHEKEQVLVCLSVLPVAVKSFLSSERLAPPNSVDTLETSSSDDSILADEKKYQNIDRLFIDILFDVLSLLLWALQRKLTSDSSLIVPRQIAATSALAGILEALDSASYFDSSLNKSVSFPNQQDLQWQLLAAVGETFATSIFQYLPTSSTSQSQSQSRLTSSSTGSPSPRQLLSSSQHSPETTVYLSSTSFQIVISLTEAIPTYLKLWNSFSNASPNVSTIALVYIDAAHRLLSHIIRCVTTQLSTVQASEPLEMVIKCILAAFAALNSSSSYGPLLLETLLPILIEKLRLDKTVLDSITTLGLQYPNHFKSIVGNLSPELRSLLQTTILESQQASTAASSSDRSKKDKDKSKKKRRDGSRQMDTETPDAIQLTTDFSQFGQKRL